MRENLNISTNRKMINLFNNLTIQYNSVHNNNCFESISTLSNQLVIPQLLKINHKITIAITPQNRIKYNSNKSP